MRKHLVIVFWLSLMILPAAGSAAGRPAIMAVEDMRAGATETLTLTFDQPVKHRKFFRLGNPPRLVLDLPTAEAGNLHFAPAEANGLVQALRFGQNTPDTSRLVLVLVSNVGQVSAIDQDNRIVITIATENGAALPAPATAPPPPGVNRPIPPIAVTHASPPLQTTKRSQPTDIQRNIPAMPQQTSSGTTSSPNKALVRKAPPVASTSKAVASEKPISKLPLVVIDAGHGGKDPGAEGVRQSHEKDVTLRYARILRDALVKSGRYRVVLTRDDDRFILLGERVRIGQKAGAGIFISLHADSAMGSGARGLSVYTVSETASDATAAALADKENSADILAGFKVDVADEEAAGILLELAQRDTKNKGSDFADQLVSAMGRQNIRLLPSPHRFAGFRVLKAPDVPSVLIETGFLSNEADEAQLQSEAYPKKVAAGILGGLDAYFARHPAK